MKRLGAGVFAASVAAAAMALSSGGFPTGHQDEAPGGGYHPHSGGVGQEGPSSVSDQGLGEVAGEGGADGQPHGHHGGSGGVHGPAEGGDAGDGVISHGEDGLIALADLTHDATDGSGNAGASGDESAGEGGLASDSSAPGGDNGFYGGGGGAPGGGTGEPGGGVGCPIPGAPECATSPPPFTPPGVDTPPGTGPQSPPDDGPVIGQGGGKLPGEWGDPHGDPDPLSAVPEPAAWVMLMLGFAALGQALRTRRVRRPA